MKKKNQLSSQNQQNWKSPESSSYLIWPGAKEQEQCHFLPPFAWLLWEQEQSWSQLIISKEHIQEAVR